MRAAVGAAVVALYALAFWRYAPGCRRPELVLEVPRDPIGAGGGTVPAGLAPRIDTVGAGPGLRYTRYAVTYRGGFTRAVGVASLAGPFQDPAHPACTGRVVVSQRLLDDGHAGPGTIAHEVARAIDAELAGERYFGIGDYVRVSDVSLRWTQLVRHPEDIFLVGDAPAYVRATAKLEFDRIAIPLTVALIPEPRAAELGFHVIARAELEVDNSVLQWLSDKLGGDKLATRLARRQIDGALITALAPPPPLDLPGGGRLAFTYCDGAPEIVDGEHGALPFAVAIGRVPGRAILPPRRGPAPHPALGPGERLAIDLDLDGANAVLYELWRAGLLDRRLADAGLDRRFNTDPTVTEYLTLRISPPRLALPPTLAVVARTGKLALRADARVTIADGDARTTGRVWGALDFQFASDQLAPVAVDLGALELSCERGPTTLVPCYGDLVAALRDRGAALHGELTRTFAALLDDVFVGQRVGAAGLTAELAIRGVRPRLTTAGDNAALHLALDAALVPRP